MSLTEEEFKQLIAYEKEFKENYEISLGPPPLKWSREIVSKESNDLFLLDFNRGIFKLEKFSLNKRFKKTIILVRLCSANMHTNPDGEKIKGSHIHIYREGYDTKYAYPIARIGLSVDMTKEQMFEGFMKYCNVINLPNIQSSLL